MTYRSFPVYARTKNAMVITVARASVAGRAVAPMHGQQAKALEACMEVH
jgi:hypothetical protein